MEIVCISKGSLQTMGYDSFRQWNKDPKNLYIGKHVPSLGIKESIWFNGDMKDEQYRAHIGTFLKSIDGVKKLGCWCKDTETCHGNIIIDLVTLKEGASEGRVTANLEIGNLSEDMGKLNISKGTITYREWLWRTHGITYEEECERVRLLLFKQTFGYEG